jgi:periplasmic divalent cation tolerance protein
MADAETAARVVLTTAPDAETGALIARALVEERLAACVNVIPGVRSIYRWGGEIQDDPEVVLIVKTRAERCEALAARIQDLHPYDVPEVLVLPALGGSAPYLAWISAETRP